MEEAQQRASEGKAQREGERDEEAKESEAKGSEETKKIPQPNGILCIKQQAPQASFRPLPACPGAKVQHLLVEMVEPQDPQRSSAGGSRRTVANLELNARSFTSKSSSEEQQAKQQQHPRRSC